MFPLKCESGVSRAAQAPCSKPQTQKCAATSLKKQVKLELALYAAIETKEAASSLIQVGKELLWVFSMISRSLASV